MNKKIYLFIVLALMASIVFASEKSPWYQQLYDYVSKGIRVIEIRTGKVDYGKFNASKNDDIYRSATIKVHKDYVKGRFFVGKDISLEAALPDLTPYSLLVSKQPNDGSNIYSRVFIKINLWGFANSICKIECSRQEHIDLSLQWSIKSFTTNPKENKELGLIRYVDTSNTHRKGRELYIPIKKGKLISIECGYPSGRYRWCDSWVYMNDDITYRYKFERKHIDNLQEIHKNISIFMNEVVIDHGYFNERI